jgi:hypothetical protein
LIQSWSECISPAFVAVSEVLSTRYGRSITGLAYSALPMGAVPEGYEQIVLLEGVSFDTVLYDDIAYRFKTTPGFTIQKLNDNEITSIDTIVSNLGNLTTAQIVEKMHS